MWCRKFLYETKFVYKGSPEIVIPLLVADGIGATKLPESEKAKCDDEDMIRVAESMLLPAQLQRVVDYIRESGHDIGLEMHDLSAETRMSKVSKYAYQKHYMTIAKAIGKARGWLKMPTTTCTQREDIDPYIEANDIGFENQDERDAYVNRQEHSPNAALRKILGERRGISVMERPFYPSELIGQPTNIAQIELMSPEISNPLFTEGPDENTFYRRINRKELISFAENLVRTAVGQKKDIIVASKHTIDPLDKIFEALIGETAHRLFPEQFVVIDKTNKDRKAEFKAAGKILIQPWLYDSYLPGVLRSGHSDKLVACLPDHALMQAGLRDLSAQDVINPATLDKEKRHTKYVERAANGSGYGEDEAHTKDEFRVTHTLNPRDIIFEVQRSLKKAGQQGTEPIILLATGMDNPADKRFVEIANSVRGAGEFKTITISEAMKRLTVDPLDQELQVFITPNHLGDYESDLIPQLYYWPYEAAAMGAGENLNFVYDEGGDIIAIGADPSTGTAPDKVEYDEEQGRFKTNEILPAGIIFSLASLLAERKDLGGELNVVGQRLRQATLNTLEKAANWGGDYANFTDEVIAEDKRLAA